MMIDNKETMKKYKKNKVYLGGYFVGNLGDDLFLKVIADRYKWIDFDCYAHKEYTVFDEYGELGNVNFKQYNITKKLYNALKKLMTGLKILPNYTWLQALAYDVIVVASGSIYTERQDQKKYNPMQEYGLLIKKKFAPKRFLVGNNFGPYITEEYYNNHIPYFNSCTDVCFRDRYSYNLFKEKCGVVRYAPDVIFNLEIDNVTYQKIYQESYVVISIIDLEPRNDLGQYKTDYYNALKKMISYLTKRKKKIVLMSFCEIEGDRKAIHEFCDEVSEDVRKDIYIYSYHYNLAEALSVIYYSEAVIATRFHAMILGWLYKKRTYPIVYSDKMKNVIDDVAFEGNILDIKNIEKFDEKVFFSSINILENIDEIVKHSECQFQMLDEQFDQSKNI